MEARSRGRAVAGGIVPLVLVAVLLAYMLGPGSEMLRLGVPLPEISIERVDFVGSEILATVRNTGPVPVDVALADVNDRIQPAAVEPDRHLERLESALVRIPFEWNVAEPYAIGITTDDGTRFEKMVDAAAPATRPTWDLAAFFALVGTFVGVVPVVIGMLWLPFLRGMSSARYHFFLALTAGLLLFLAIDATEEALDISRNDLAGAFNGALLVATAIALSFLALYYSGERLAGRTGPAAAGLMISVGIGLHNFGEGLAIGAAIGIGSLAFGTFLIVGFTLHNVTEGLAIAASVSRRRPALPVLAALAMIAGAPAILGAWTGGFAYSPVASAIFLGVGAGAILQVVLVVLRWIRNEGGRFSSPSVTLGLASGMLVMYLTSILV
ncbi:MAG: divalent cation transporter [Nitrosopumilus sp. H8]|nr:MAG: divalent cation transporter [Nitrosopumilus sp. H8]